MRLATIFNSNQDQSIKFCSWLSFCTSRSQIMSRSTIVGHNYLPSLLVIFSKYTSMFFFLPLHMSNVVIFYVYIYYEYCVNIYIRILKCWCHYHHHVVPLARISLTLSRYFSLSFIASGRSSGLHPISSHSCCMYVRAGHPAFAWPYAGVHRSTSLMSSSLFLQQCPVCKYNGFHNLQSIQNLSKWYVCNICI